MKKIKYLLLLLSTLFIGQGISAPFDNFRWSTLTTKSTPSPRHETSFVEYKDQFYLIGGRGIKPVDVYNPVTNIWQSKGETPMEIHHFQAVVYGDAIYIVGGMTGKYPRETPLENIWLYYPEKDKWEQGPAIPKERQRGSGAVVIYHDKIWFVGGIKLGHTSGTSNYFDSYDLKTGKWQSHTDAPHIRDHFPAVVVDDKLYCVGGRNSSVHYEGQFSAFFTATVAPVDYYDFKQEKWFTLKAPLPYPTAAGGLVSLGHHIIYMGGEGRLLQAYNQTQCLDVNTGQWSPLAPMVTGRHGSGAILYKDEIYMVAGSDKRGGANISSMEKFSADHKWQSLFDGESLDGWELRCVEKDRAQEFWKVEEGMIVCNSLHSNAHNYVWLQHQEEFDDFELRLQFQVDRKNKGNSGVQFRSRYDAEAEVEKGLIGWLDGPQADIDGRHPFRCGLIYDETRETKRWIYPSLPNWNISPENAHHKVRFYFGDEETGWNDMRMVCEGFHIQVFVNNVKVTDYAAEEVLNDEVHQKYNVGRSGHIALQLHKKNANLMRFRRIEIRDL